jgi:hypothetical protein
MKSRGSQERSSGTEARGGGTVVWAVVVWARVVIGLVLGAAGGVAFGHAWTSESAPWWWVGAISLLTGVLLLLSGLYARSRPPGTSPEFVAREQAPAAQEPLVPLLGALLVYKYQRISHATLDKALEHQRTETNRRRLGEILVSMEAVTWSDVEEALEYQRTLARQKREQQEQHQPAG